jgi:hypothetical protein
MSASLEQTFSTGPVLAAAVEPSTIGFILVGAVVVLWIAMSLTPKARARRAEARRKREEMAQLRSRLSANAQRTYDKQFGKSRRGRAKRSSSDSGAAYTPLMYAGDSGDSGSRGSDCDTSSSSGWSWGGGGDSGGGWGGGDSGGGGGDGGGGSC